ncbi:MAG: hypothetical protein KA745_06350 [Gemmatimonadales bacterium]|jgi:hypothetical protein|nr:hypothetical protein [Gemmatimonadales bacterium]
MTIRSAMTRVMLAAAILVPSGVSAEEGAGEEWSSVKPWWVYTVSNVAQYYTSATQYSGVSMHNCTNGTGWWATGDLDCSGN